MLAPYNALIHIGAGAYTGSDKKNTVWPRETKGVVPEHIPEILPTRTYALYARRY